MNIEWEVLTVPSVGVNRMLHVYRVRRPATQSISRTLPDAMDKVNAGGRQTGSTARERLPYYTTRDTNPQRSAPPTWNKTCHHNSQASQEGGSWGPSLTTSGAYNQSPRT